MGVGERRAGGGTAMSEAKGHFLFALRMCAAQLRPPCFAAGPAPVAARCFPSVETTYHITWHVARHTSVLLRVLTRMAAVAVMALLRIAHRSRRCDPLASLQGQPDHKPDYQADMAESLHTRPCDLPHVRF